MPEARMINMMRHPMDTCYANFKMLFNAGAPYSYSLKDLGHYYSAYHELMQHWHKVLPGAIHTVHYEQLTSSFEEVLRSALDFCGLQWQDEVLNFHENKTASTTASAAQVRQPINTQAIGRATAYADHFRLIVESLGLDTSS